MRMSRYLVALAVVVAASAQQVLPGTKPLVLEGDPAAQMVEAIHSFLDRESLLKGGRRGPAIVPGKPEQSVLVELLRHEGELQMPPGPKLPEKEIKALTEWIRRGAVWGTKLNGK